MLKSVSDIFVTSDDFDVHHLKLPSVFVTPDEPETPKLPSPTNNNRKSVWRHQLLVQQWRIGYAVFKIPHANLRCLCSQRNGHTATANHHLIPDNTRMLLAESNIMSVTRNHWTSLEQTRYYSKRPSFFSQIVENIKSEMSKNKEMKENLKRFREEAEKLEQSDALKKARAKFVAVESEASVLKEKMGQVKKTMSEVLEEAGKSDIAKKAGQISEGISKQARDAAETLSEKGQRFGATGTFKTISSATAAVKKELDQTGSQARVYIAPDKLRKRLETTEGTTKVYNPDEVTLDVELHKDSKFYQSWENFKNNNKYVNKILDYKLKYEESENPMIRASRLLTDKMTDIVGNLFQNTEMSETLTEIVKMDPSFDKTKFLLQCEQDIVPNILEAMIRGDLEILKDWCHEGPFNVLSVPIKEAKRLQLSFDSKILDIENLDLAMGKIMDQGPVLIITFTSQQILCFRDRGGKIKEGDPDKVLRVHYVWALSRDREVLDPRAAWRLLDISATSTEQFV